MTHWDQRFMRIAEEVSSWSKDPGTKVGAVLVKDRRIISTGFNGFPQGIVDSLENYLNRDIKLQYTVHAEMNAILNAAASGAKTNGSTLFTTFPPCVSCATCIIQAQVAKVISPPVSSAPERWKESFTKGHDLLVEAGVEVLNFDPVRNGRTPSHNESS
jgi:dCMP deaminase